LTGPETSSLKASAPITRAPWDLTVYMRHARICDTFLQVAEDTYRDFLPRVREDLAGAMSIWLRHDRYGADVQWSDAEGCFIGHIRDAEDDIQFRGLTPSELHQAFKDAVEAYKETSVYFLPAPDSASLPEPHNDQLGAKTLQGGNDEGFVLLMHDEFKVPAVRNAITYAP